jgi:hypothetical protein
MEQAGARFHERVERAFERFLTPEWQAAHPECGPILAVDASGSRADVFSRLLGALEARWPDLVVRSRLGGESRV